VLALAEPLQLHPEASIDHRLNPFGTLGVPFVMAALGFFGRHAASSMAALTV
jgi:hypothetical protein